MSQSSNYCKHGNYVGNPWGPDYMCPWCETGEEPPAVKLERVTETFKLTGNLLEGSETERFLAMLNGKYADWHLYNSITNIDPETKEPVLYVSWQRYVEIKD